MSLSCHATRPGPLTLGHAALALAMMLACLTSAVPAEVIHLRNGRTIEGIVQERRNGRVFILTSTGLIGIAETEIDTEIREIDESEALTRIRVQLDTGQFMMAMGSIRQFLDRTPPGDEILVLQQMLAARHEALEAGLRVVSPPEAEAMLEMLDATLSSDKPTSPASAAQASTGQAYRAALAIWWRSIGHRARARQHLLDIYDPLGEPWGHLNERLLRLCIEEIRHEVDNPSNLNPEALDMLLSVTSALDAPVGRAFSTWSWLRMARHAMLQGNARRALEICLHEISPIHPEIARHRARIIFNDIGPRMHALREWDALVELYEEFGLKLLGREADPELARALEAAGQAALERGDLDLARLSFIRLDALDTGDAERLLLLTEFQARQIATPRADLVARLELGIWAAQQRLYPQARLLFEELMRHPDLEEPARVQREIYDRQEAVELVDRATAAARNGQYMEAVDIADAFLSRFQLSELRNQMRAVREAALRDLRAEESQRPLRAESLYQQAERLFFMQEYPQALQLLDRVELDYADTPGADRAQALKGRVLSRLYGNLPDAMPGAGAEASLRLPDMPTARQADDLGLKPLRDELLDLARLLRRYLPHSALAPPPAATPNPLELEPEAPGAP